MKYIDLIEQLPAQDKTILHNYLTTYGIAEDNFIGVDNWLQNWTHSKQNLYKLLGNNFIVKFPIEFEKSEEDLTREIKMQLLNHDFKINYHRFYWDIIKEKYKDHSLIDPDNVFAFNHITDIAVFRENKVRAGIKWKKPGCNKVLQIQTGEKPMRALLKIINYFKDEFDFSMKAFEDFRIVHSLIFNDKCLKGNMCISIHPLDFVTMSDNNCDWNSCMSWVHDGCYHEGTIEMMNSNNTLCCYLESSTPYNFYQGASYFDAEEKIVKKEDYIWNNKKWRVLAYITKDIIMSGKAYPYESDKFSLCLIEKIKDLAKQNLNWTYTFGPERYNDMVHINAKSTVERARGYMKYNPRKHNIIWDTKGMYNDMLNANVNYWCYRNKVKKTKIISVSGKAPCLCCGDSIVRDTSDYTDDYNERYENANHVVCEDCYRNLEDEYSCSICESTMITHPLKEMTINGKTIRICPECFNNYIRECPCCKKPIVLSESFYRSYDSPEEPIYYNLFVTNHLDYLTSELKQAKAKSEKAYNDFLYEIDESCVGRPEYDENYLDKKEVIEHIYVCPDCKPKLIEEADYVLIRPRCWFRGETKSYLFRREGHEQFRFQNLNKFSSRTSA